MMPCLTNVSYTEKQKWHEGGFKLKIKRRLGGTGWLPGAPRIPQITTSQAAHMTAHHGVQIIRRCWWSHCSKMCETSGVTV